MLTASLPALPASMVAPGLTPWWAAILYPANDQTSDPQPSQPATEDETSYYSQVLGTIIYLKSKKSSK